MMDEFWRGIEFGVLLAAVPLGLVIVALFHEVSFQKAKVRRLQPMTKETYQEMRGI